MLDDLSDVQHILGIGLPQHEYANKVQQMSMLEGHLQCLWVANVDLEYLEKHFSRYSQYKIMALSTIEGDYCL